MIFLDIAANIQVIALVLVLSLLLAGFSLYNQYVEGKKPKVSAAVDIAQPTQAINRLAGRVINGFADLTRHISVKPDSGRDLYAQKFGQMGQASYALSAFCKDNEWLKEVSSKGLVLEVYDENLANETVHSRILVGEYLQQGEKPLPVVIEMYNCACVEGIAITNITVVVSTQDCGDQCRTDFFSLMTNSLKAFPATRIKRTIIAGKGRINILTVNELGHLTATLSEVVTTDEKTLLATYAPLEIAVGGIRRIADAISAVNVLRLVLNKGRSAMITGPLGSGKTSFVKQTLAGLAENIHAFLINIDALNTFATPAGRSFLLTEMRRRKAQDEKLDPHFVLVIDEAHQLAEKDSEVITGLLSMADGLDSDTFNLSILLSVNDESVLDKALTRANRFEAQVHISKMMPEQAESAFSFVKEGLDGHVLNEAAKAKVMKRSEISLADIYQCFQRSDLAEAIAALSAIPEVPTPMT